MIINIADILSNYIVLLGFTLILGTFVHIWYSESRDIVNKRVWHARLLYRSLGVPTYIHPYFLLHTLEEC